MYFAGHFSLSGLQVVYFACHFSLSGIQIVYFAGHFSLSGNRSCIYLVTSLCSSTVFYLSFTVTEKQVVYFTCYTVGVFFLSFHCIWDRGIVSHQSLLCPDTGDVFCQSILPLINFHLIMGSTNQNWFWDVAICLLVSLLTIFLGHHGRG